MDRWVKRLFGFSHIPRVGYNPKSDVVADHCKTIQYIRTERLWPDPDLDNPAHRSIRFSADSLDRIWKSARKQAEIEDVRLHDLRHSVASQAVLKGVPLPVVARLLGHSQVSMTLRFAHVADKEVEAAAERVDRVIANLCGISDP